MQKVIDLKKMFQELQQDNIDKATAPYSIKSRQTIY